MDLGKGRHRSLDQKDHFIFLFGSLRWKTGRENGKSFHEKGLVGEALEVVCVLFVGFIC